MANSVGCHSVPRVAAVAARTAAGIRCRACTGRGSHRPPPRPRAGRDRRPGPSTRALADRRCALRTNWAVNGTRKAWPRGAAPALTRRSSRRARAIQFALFRHRQPLRAIQRLVDRGFRGSTMPGHPGAHAHSDRATSERCIGGSTRPDKCLTWRKACHLGGSQVRE
jgi:hypothetical protein